MVATVDRYDIERRKWDAYAEARLVGLRPLRAGTTFARYARDRLLLRGIPEFLGDLRERRIVEFGCGTGALSCVLAMSGARVTAFDLSEASVEVARRRAKLNGISDAIDFVVAAGEELPWPDEHFDAAIGKSVLHHMDPVAAGPELARVLRTGGRAAFSEPQGRNPLLNLIRDRVPYPGKHERGADIPLRTQDIRAWTAPFSRATVREVQLLSMLERGFGTHQQFRTLRRMDDLLLERIPALRPLTRYVILYLEK